MQYAPRVRFYSVPRQKSGTNAWPPDNQLHHDEHHNYIILSCKDVIGELSDKNTKVCSDIYVMSATRPHNFLLPLETSGTPFWLLPLFHHRDGYDQMNGHLWSDYLAFWEFFCQYYCPVEEYHAYHCGVLCSLQQRGQNNLWCARRSVSLKDFLSLKNR